MSVRFPHLAVLGMAALFALPAWADDDDRNLSVYDQHPECLERSDAAAADAKCVMPANQIPDQIILRYPDSSDAAQAAVPAPAPH